MLKCITLTRDELGTDRYQNRKYRYRKSSKMETGIGTEYTWHGTVPVQYRYLRVKPVNTGTVLDRYRTGTENVKSWYRIGTKKVPGSVNSVPVPDPFCSSISFTHF
ncbi:hypothetical protein Hanom_Chr16g01490931 [Helianthus anomalus]